MDESDVSLEETNKLLSEPRQLTTVDEMTLWHCWNLTHNGDEPNEETKLEIRASYEEDLVEGVLGTGNDSTHPAIFAIFDGDKIVSAGAVFKKQHKARYAPGHLPDQQPYARIDDGQTDAEFQNKGLNTKITQARINWAIQQGLPWVETWLDPYNYSTVKAKLKAGFILEDFTGNAIMVYPIADNIKKRLGIRDSITTDQSIPATIEPDIGLQQRLKKEYGVYDPSNMNTQQGFAPIRMISRSFATPLA